MSAGPGLTRREADVFACLADTVVAPGPGMPAVAATDARSFFADYLRAAPRVNRVVLRGLLYALEVGPLALGYRQRLRRLGPAERVAYLDRVDRGPARMPAEAIEALAELAYYGDDRVMRALGYDADAVVARGRELRRREARW